MDSEENYRIHRAWTVYGYQASLRELGQDPASLVAMEMNDDRGWQTEPKERFAATIVSLSIISLREGFLPDYLESRIVQLPDPSELADEDDRALYIDDLQTLEVLRAHVSYSI